MVTRPPECLVEDGSPNGNILAIVSQDVRKLFRLSLKKDGYVLEQLFSPLIVHRTPGHEELKRICCPSPHRRSSRGYEAHSASGSSRSLLTSAATGVIAKHHAHHYFGFATTQWKLFDRS